MRKFSQTLIDFIEEYPEVWKAHESAGVASHSSGPLDAKTSHLIQAAAAASRQLRGSMHSHIVQAVEAGATPQEVMHMVVLLTNTIGFPGMMIAYRWAREILARIEAEKH